MSLLRKIMSPQGSNRRDEVLRALLEKMSGDEQSTALLQDVLKALPNLTDEEKQRLTENPGEFLFPKPVERPADKSAPVTPRPTALNNDLTHRIQAKVNEVVTEPVAGEALRQQIADIVNTIVGNETILLSRSERERLIDGMMARAAGYDVLDAYMRDDAVSEIRVIGPKQIYIVRKGHFEAAPVTFDDEDAVLRVIDRMMAPTGKRIDEMNPMGRIRLNDGSIVTVIVRPLSQQGPSLYIQKFNRRPLQREDLMRFGTVTGEVMEFLRAAVLAGIHIIIAGRMGAGKTMLMDVLANLLPDDLTVVTIEALTELQLHQPQVLALQTRPPNMEGKEAVSAQQLAEFAVQFRADRVMLNHTGGAGLLPLLDRNMPVMAEVPGDAATIVQRLKQGLMAEQPGLSENAALALLTVEPVLVVEIQQLRDGTRKVMLVAELLPDGSLMPMFYFEQTGLEKGRILGRLRPEPLHSRRILDRIEDAGIHLLPPAKNKNDTPPLAGEDGPPETGGGKQV